METDRINVDAPACLKKQTSVQFLGAVGWKTASWFFVKVKSLIWYCPGAHNYKSWHGENNNSFCFVFFCISSSGDLWCLAFVRRACVVVCISIWVSTKDVWNEVQAQTRQLCPCRDVVIHAEAGWHHSSTQKEKGREGGWALLYFASQAVSRFMSPKPVSHKLLPCTRALSPAFKIWAAWQHSGAVLGDKLA